LTYILHRIGGLGMAVFISMHVFASFSARMDWQIGDVVNDIYKNWAFQLFVFFCVFFHAINGLRITILDLFPKLIDHHRQAITIEWAAFAVIYGLTAFSVIRIALGG
jgi:succinate dehydrogenase / fumarate reductase cytochrome b subunit